MKKTRLAFQKLLFLFCIIFLCGCFFASGLSSSPSPPKTVSAKNNKISRTLKIANAKEKETASYTFEFAHNGKQFKYAETDFKTPLSEFQKQMRESKDASKSIENLQGMGFSLEEAVTYVFPETKQMLEKLKSALEVRPQGEEVFLTENACEIFIEKGKEGRFLNKVSFFENFYNSLKNGKKNVSFKLEMTGFELPKLNRNEYLEKSCFSTNFETSSDARKNNIKVALSVFDGLVLEDGEVLSFNATTGVRNEKAGYQKAKIISGGTFTEGFGGGVCQVSTTLYNACLLAGLEILEVHNHSLPVSYIEPSFDAMVNVGSSDLVVRNNSGGRLIFTTSSKNDICKVKIFGKPNEFKITRFSEKTKVLKAEPEEILTSYSHLGDFDLQIGEEKRLSYAKDGFCSNGYLNFYDKQGNLIKTKKIRSNKYNPTKGLVIRREN